jgi:hypothetical protein
MRRILWAASIMSVCSVGLAATKLDVVVIAQQDNASEYTFVVDGSIVTEADASANCAALGQLANCAGSGSSTTTFTPAQERKFQVKGATLSLRLPDGRVAVVNCASKMNWTELTNPSPVRSCRVPLVKRISAEFNGDKAKLSWNVSIDGSKQQTETYKVIAVLDATGEG